MNTVPVMDGQFERMFIDHPLHEMTPTSFCLEVEKLVKEKNMNYMQAVCELCETYEIEYTAVKCLLTDTMKDKIEMDAQSLHMFRNRR